MKFSKLFKASPSRPEVGRDITVEISSAVFERIAKQVSAVDVEVGGKLLGKVRISANNITVSVKSYLDSGPRVSNSRTHILPDGEYQEALFRVLECLDPTIDHIGSWHSHHCNGLSELSSGDIQGYLRNVNDCRYNGEVFLVILVTEYDARGPSCRYWAFRKGWEACYAIPEAQVRVVRDEYHYEELLSAAESCVAAASVQKGGRCSPVVAPRAAKRCAEEFDSESASSSRESVPSGHRAFPEERELAALRAADNEWIRKNYEGARTVLVGNGRSVSWRWKEAIGTLDLLFDYQHSRGEDSPFVGAFSARLGPERILTEDIPLDSGRFAALARAVSRARVLARQVSKKVSKGGTRSSEAPGDEDD